MNGPFLRCHVQMSMAIDSMLYGRRGEIANTLQQQRTVVMKLMSDWLCSCHTLAMWLMAGSFQVHFRGTYNRFGNPEWRHPWISVLTIALHAELPLATYHVGHIRPLMRILMFVSFCVYVFSWSIATCIVVFDVSIINGCVMNESLSILSSCMPMPLQCRHNGCVRWRLKSPASRLFTQPIIRVQIKVNIKAPRHWPLCGEFTEDRWIPHTNTNGQ